MRARVNVPGMESAPTYSHRHSALAVERTYRLADDALVWEDEGVGGGRMAYADIASVRLAYRPSRVQPDRFLATIYPKKGQFVRLSNSSYRGIGDFLMHDEAYSDFLTALHQRLSDGGYDISFRKGSGPIGYAANLAMTAGILGGIPVLAFYMVSLGHYGLAVAKLLIIAWFVPTLLRFIKRSRPQRYRPDAIPKDALPWAGRSEKTRQAV